MGIAKWASLSGPQPGRMSKELENCSHHWCYKSTLENYPKKIPTRKIIAHFHSIFTYDLFGTVIHISKKMERSESDVLIGRNTASVLKRSSGLNTVPKRYVHSKPHPVTLCGIRVFTDVFKGLKMRSPLIRVGPKTKTSTLIRDKKEDTEKAKCRWRQSGIMVLQAKDHLKPPKAGGCKEGFSPRAFRQRHLDLGLLTSRVVRE